MKGFVMQTHDYKDSAVFLRISSLCTFQRSGIILSLIFSGIVLCL